MMSPLSKSAALPLLLLLSSLGANVLQARKISALLEPSRPPQPRIGQSVPAIQVSAPEGEATVLRFDVGVPTVLYYFSSTCAWCERNWSNVEALARGTHGRARVLAVSAESDLGPFFDRHRLDDVAVYAGLSGADQAALGFSSTPRTLVISAQGIVSHDWMGVYKDTSLRQIEDLFGITLPGIDFESPGALLK